jgi:hypothetical protein
MHEPHAHGEGHTLAEYLPAYDTGRRALGGGRWASTNTRMAAAAAKLAHLQMTAHQGTIDDAGTYSRAGSHQPRQCEPCRRSIQALRSTRRAEDASGGRAPRMTSPLHIRNASTALARGVMLKQFGG